MARIITKELAQKIVRKLGAVKAPAQARGAAHDLYSFEFEGVIVARLSVRRSSEKDTGHDHLPKQLHLGPGQAKRLGQCPLSLAEYVGILRQKGILGPAPAGDGLPPAGEPHDGTGPAPGEPPA